MWNQNPSGLSYSIKGITAFRYKHYSLSKENVEFTDEQLKAYSKATIDYLATLGKFGDRIKAKNSIDESSPFIVSDFQEIEPEFIYKYISSESLEFYSKGNFQVGSTGYFQKMENEKARDELEGMSFISTQLRDRIANATIELGFNHYIFCATDQGDEHLRDYHTNNFGPVLLKIKAKPFLAKVAKRLGAKSYSIRKVKYSNAKLLATDLDISIAPEDLSNLDSSGCIELANHIVSNCTIPTLFIKSGWFVDEEELRVVFTMPHNVNQTLPKRFKHCGLLKYIDIIK